MKDGCNTELVFGRKNCFQITVLLRHVSSLDWRVSLQYKCLLNLKPCKGNSSLKLRVAPENGDEHVLSEMVPFFGELQELLLNR